MSKLYWFLANKATETILASSDAEWFSSWLADDDRFEDLIHVIMTYHIPTWDRKSEVAKAIMAEIDMEELYCRCTLLENYVPKTDGSVVAQDNAQGSS